MSRDYRGKNPILVLSFLSSKSRKCSVNPKLCPSIFLHDKDNYLYVALQLRKDPGKETVGQHWYPITQRFNNEAEALVLPAGDAQNVTTIIYKLIEYATLECDEQIPHVGVVGINKEDIASKYFLFLHTAMKQNLKHYYSY